MLLASAILTSLLAQSTSDDVPYPLQDRGGPTTLREGHQAGRIRWVTAEKTVVIDWTASAIVHQQPNWALAWDSQTNALGSFKPQSGSQMLPVRYFPTAAAGLSSKAMLVGGLTTGGNTVIEVWALEWPTPMPAPSTNISTGLTTVAVALPSLAQVVRLYDADVPGQRLVRNLCMVRPSTGNPTSCLVQFHDSSDIYQIALESGSMSLIASPSSSHGSLGVVPGLMPSNHYSIHVADHGVAGFVYTLVRGIKLAPVPSPSSPPIVLLLDGNRDGTLDSFLHVSHVDYQSQGWNDLNNYTSWWLN